MEIFDLLGIFLGIFILFLLLEFSVVYISYNVTAGYIYSLCEKDQKVILLGEPFVCARMDKGGKIL